MRLRERRDLLLEGKAQHKAEDFVDQMDTAIRLLLSHLGMLKEKDRLKQQVHRSISQKDQVCCDCRYVFRVWFLRGLFV